MKPHTRCVLYMIFATFTLVSTGFAVGGPTLTASQMERYNNLTHQLIAPCCWREPIAIHRSAEALQMLDEVKRFVMEGRSEEEIKAMYVARYGVRILADPPGSEGRWLYVIPIALFCGLVFRVILHLRSLVARVSSPNSSVPPELIARIRSDTDTQ